MGIARSLTRSALVALPLVTISLAGCGDPDDIPDGTEGVEAPVVYGKDDRQDAFAFKNRSFAKRAAAFSAVMVNNDTLNLNDPRDIKFNADILQVAFGVCADERFANQLTAGDCSATLVAPDLVLTAGHCIEFDTCAQKSFVFNYSMANARRLEKITSEDIFRCKEVVAREFTEDSLDFAVVRLDRRVNGRTPARVSSSRTAIRNNAKLVVSGYPSGLPLKIADGAKVRDNNGRELDFFISNLDTFGGNSGSGVFREGSDEQVGILVRGEEDYVATPQGCQRVNRCPNNGCNGEDSTYAFRAIDALCEVADAFPLCAH